MKAFEGTHDFTSFMANSRTINDYGDDYCLRKIDCFQMSPLALDSIQNFTPLYKNVDIYNFKITSKSFLYKQVMKLFCFCTKSNNGNLIFLPDSQNDGLCNNERT